MSRRDWPRNTESQRRLDRIWGEAMAPDDVRYILCCHECGHGLYRRRDSPVVKRARRGEQPCSCSDDGEYVLIRDGKPD